MQQLEMSHLAALLRHKSRGSGQGPPAPLLLGLQRAVIKTEGMREVRALNPTIITAMGGLVDMSIGLLLRDR